MAPKQQFNVYLTPDTVTRMKHRAIDAQLSLSDLVEQILTRYLATPEDEQHGVRPDLAASTAVGLALQPMVHVADMGQALDFYRALGAVVQHGSRDGDWALVRFGGTDLGLLAHPANPEQHEGKVELNFDAAEPLAGFEERLREAGVTIVRPTGDEGFGYQLQIADPDGMLVKINQLDPTLYR